MKIQKLLGVLAALVVTGLGGWYLISHRGDRVGNPTMTPELALPDATPGTLVRLSAGKQASITLEVAAVKRQTLILTRTLPGRFTYDETRHVSVRAPTDSVLESVLVQTGDAVQLGQPIAMVRSPAVGNARREILDCQARLALADKELHWESQIDDGVTRLVAAIRRHDSIESIEEQLGDSTLGMYRSQLLTKYSQYQLASRLSHSVQQVGPSGAISGRVVQQRLSETQQTWADLEATMEQSLFESHQARQRAEAAAESARRSLLMARQSLSNLLGPTADANTELDVSPNETNLSQLTVVSPLGGTVERRNFSAMERVAAGDEMFVIADTSQLWLEADVRGGDWSSLQVSAGDEVRVTTPALPDLIQPGEVYFLGREVDPASGALALIVKVSNVSQRYRPGLFARVEVPVGKLESVIAIPEAALVDLDGQTSVFVVEGDHYRGVAVTPGVRSGDVVQIESGLREGEQVVVRGTFVLKSEWLLEGEE